MANTVNDYVELFSNTPRLKWLLLASVILIIASFWLNYLIPIAFLAAFCFLDVIGYKHISECRDALYLAYEYVENSSARMIIGDKVRNAAKRVMPSYRILQGTIQVLILLLTWQYFGFWFFVASEMLHWFSLQELLYYWTVDIKLPDTWTWLHWTPFGILEGDLANSKVITQSVVGIALYILIMVVYYSKGKTK